MVQGTEVVDELCVGDEGQPVDSAGAVDPALEPDAGRAEEDRNFAEQVKKVALAAAGAVSISADDLKGFVSRLVEKGELAQQDGRRIVQDLSGRLKRVVSEPVQTARDAAEQAEGAIKQLAEKIGRRDPDEAEAHALAERINASIERVLKAVRIASSGQLEGLKAKIDELEVKLERVVAGVGVEETTGV